MGARPVAALNALRFGAPEHPRTRHLVSGVVAGVGGYGNSFGVPTVGGEVEFDPSYDGNCLVNAMAVGLADIDKIFLSKAEGVGMPIVYLGSKTGRDGVGGATMASAAFDDTIEEKRPTVQVGDPFSEKLLLEACLELMATGAVIAIQDMGAAGLTCSAVEMGAKGDLGVRLDLDHVPVREEAMSAYEMMLSESQERMLMVLRPDLRAEAEAIFVKWGLDFAVVGETTDDLRFSIWHMGEEVANLPIKELGDEAPEYDRPWGEPAKPAPLAATDVPAPADLGAALVSLVGSPNQSSRRWVWEQYDNLILGETVAGPGGDAALVRIGDQTQGLAMTVDVTPRYCAADPFEGGKQAVAEAWRNLSAIGAEPLAVTDNLNFGNPERPEIMGQFVGCIKGIGEACTALDFPVVSGNVSLYNATGDEAILPTPTIGGVGLLADYRNTAVSAFGAAGERILLVGGHGTEMGQSIYLRDVLGRTDGPAAARRPRGRARQRRFRPHRHPRDGTALLPRHLVRRPGPGAGRDGDGLGTGLHGRRPRSGACRPVFRGPGTICSVGVRRGCRPARRRRRRGGHRHRRHRRSGRHRIDGGGIPLHIRCIPRRGARGLVPDLHGRQLNDRATPSRRKDTSAPWPWTPARSRN